jgi:hypothetical protein
MPTLEEAGRCPRCSQAGKRGATLPTNEIGKKVIMFTCENSRCRWFDTGWPVQINADGSIPVTGGKGDKLFDGKDSVANSNAAVERANREAGSYE